MIHASYEYSKLHWYRCSCGHVTSRNLLLRKLRSHPKAVCTKCKTTIHQTEVGAKYKEWLSIQKQRKEPRR